MHRETILSGRRLWQRARPFPHIVGEGVLAPDVYRDVEEAFRSELCRGLGEAAATSPPTHRFARTVPGYGAHVKALTRETTGALALFVSRGWHDMIAGLWGIEATGDVDAALHHHPVGSGDGWVHNDLNPGWFVDQPKADGVNLSDSALCNYQHGPADPLGSSSLVPRETVRAAALLFYLANDPWSPGDGGETGLYSSLHSPVSRPAAVVPPLNNSLLCFACTPFSCHAFLSNRRSPRNSVILWLHVPRAQAEARHGARSIEPWRSR
ncbi:2OG-Fe(II) oxygenase [Sorangium sp. So ce426]|uniref:2OG-Fe(II) oxygenase n=1 Tax=Sorangium sp. So ce426 TaxID=3133312 RepID=UPI003F5AEF0F